jgi:hypothetical protein
MRLAMHSSASGGALTNSLLDVPEKSDQELFDWRADIQLRQAEALSASSHCRIWALGVHRPKHLSSPAAARTQERG